MYWQGVRWTPHRVQVLRNSFKCIFNDVFCKLKYVTQVAEREYEASSIAVPISVHPVQAI